MQKLLVSATLFALAGLVTILPSTRPTRSPAPPQVAVVTTPPSKISSQSSPDGKFIVTLTHTADVATVSIGSTAIFTHRMSPDTVVSLPFNTWSPNNKYLFIKEVGTSDTSYIVMSASGASPANVTEFFAESYPDLKLNDVTGWADGTLLVVNYTSSAGKPASLWFDVTSHHFIPLAVYFN